MRRLFALFLAVFLVLRTGGAGEQGDRVRTLDPRQLPLFVLRSSGNEALNRLLATRQARSLGWDRFDLSGKIPGIDGRLASSRALLSGLADRQASDLWFCLAGSSILSQNGVFGATWSGQDGPEALRSWLQTHIAGFDPALEIEAVSRQRQRWIAAGDKTALADALAGGGRSEPWRDDLRSFMQGEAGSLAVWFNLRPILGAAALTLEADFRGEASHLGLNVPETAEIRAEVAGVDAQLSLRIARIVPEENPVDAGGWLLVENRNPSLFSLNIPEPLTLLKRFGLDEWCFTLANLNERALAPEAARLDLWRTAAGGIGWSLVCYFDDKEPFLRQLRRARAWLDIIAASPASGLTVTDEPGAGERRRHRLGEYSWLTGVVEDEGGSAWFVAASGPEAFPEADDLSLVEADQPLLASWSILPDQAARAAIITAVSGLAGDRFPTGLDAETLDSLLLPGDNGELFLDDNSLHFVSRRGATLLAGAGGFDMVRREFNRLFRDPRRLTAARLRFLLYACDQSRFREAAIGNSATPPLPGDLSELAFDYAGGRHWLDNALPAFPGHGLPLSEIMPRLAGDSGFEGCRYRITLNDGEWFLMAESEDGSAMRVDARGVAGYRATDDGEWAAYVDPLLGLGL